MKTESIVTSTAKKCKKEKKRNRNMKVIRATNSLLSKFVGLNTENNFVFHLLTISLPKGSPLTSKVVWR